MITGLFEGRNPAPGTLSIFENREKPRLQSRDAISVYRDSLENQCRRLDRTWILLGRG